MPVEIFTRIYHSNTYSLTCRVRFMFLFARALHRFTAMLLSSISTMTTNDGSMPASAASQRAETQALAELSQRSAGLGRWDVGIFRPHIYDFKRTNKLGQ